MAREQLTGNAETDYPEKWNEVWRMKAAADADEGYASRCIEGEKVFYVEASYAFIPGHIYSAEGRDEFRISQACEYHFDEWFQDDEDDDEDSF